MPGVGDGQGGLACCDSWGRKESDVTERLNCKTESCIYLDLATPQPGTFRLVFKPQIDMVNKVSSLGLYQESKKYTGFLSEPLLRAGKNITSRSVK